jgi:hypothetical protein
VTSDDSVPTPSRKPGGNFSKNFGAANCKFRRALEPLIARPPGELAPLSPGLEQLWFTISWPPALPSITNRSPFTNGDRWIRLVLERCFNEIARRHEIWRSAIPHDRWESRSASGFERSGALPLIDLSHLPVESAKRRPFESGLRTFAAPFDLNVAPLFRVRLVRWAEEYHRIYLTVHRLVFDCVSIDRVLIGELAALYTRIRPANRLHFLNSPFQYGDYAAWKQRQITKRQSRRPNGILAPEPLRGSAAVRAPFGPAAFPPSLTAGVEWKRAPYPRR